MKGLFGRYATPRLEFLITHSHTEGEYFQWPFEQASIVSLVPRSMHTLLEGDARSHSLEATRLIRLAVLWQFNIATFA